MERLSLIPKQPIKELPSTQKLNDAINSFFFTHPRLNNVFLKI